MNDVVKKELTVFDSTCIIVGIIIGAGIYKTAPTVAAAMGGPVGTLLVWLFGGLLALAGALCYAELASAYPHQGGDYVYQTRAYGRPAGFLFGWSQLAIVRPADITLMAFIFGTYANELVPLGGEIGPMLYAGLAVVGLTAINIVGVRQGKWTQNGLTVVKVAALAAIIVIGLGWPQSRMLAEPAGTAAGGGLTWSGLKFALIMVLFTYGGWNEMAYVAAEVRNARRNIVRALVTGTVAVTVLYLLANAAFLRSLGYGGLSQTEAVGVDAIGAVLPDVAGRVFAVVICISALGAVNGLIFTGSRIVYALGTDHAFFRWLGRWNPSRSVPTMSLIVQGLLSIGIILLAGSFEGTILTSAPVVWAFFFLTGISVFVLRQRDPLADRPYRVSGYPVTPILFCLMSAFMFYSSVTYAWAFERKAFWTLVVVMVAGAAVYAFQVGFSGPGRRP